MSSAEAVHPEILGASCSLLIVDDEPHVLHVLSALLAKDFEVLTVPSAEAARAVFAQREVDIILADQRMPGWTGVELLEWVRQNYPRTIRLMMTGFADFEDTVKAINRGQIYRIILKPWRSDELVLILKNAARSFLLERSHERLLDELRQFNVELEKRVQQRTRELEDAVRQLRQKNSMLEKFALTDPLTGLPNRRAMDGLAKFELRRRSRYPGPLALGLVDADNFKAINSRFLLPGGDQVLIHLAQTLARAGRTADTVGRIGGEEFMVVAPETPPDGASILAERMRASVEASRTSYNGESIQTTVSIGFAVAGAAQAATYEQMKHTAATALEQAKKTGRNRCVILPLT
jgi:diguanylate cyclase (GGDEF)-like protein